MHTKVTAKQRFYSAFVAGLTATAADQGDRGQNPQQRRP